MLLRGQGLGSPFRDCSTQVPISQKSSVGTVPLSDEDKQREQLLSHPVRTCEIKKSCHSINKPPPPLQLWEQLVSLALITQRKMTRRPEALWRDTTSSHACGGLVLLRGCSFKSSGDFLEISLMFHSNFAFPKIKSKIKRDTNKSIVDRARRQKC